MVSYAEQCKLVHLWKISFNKRFAFGSGSGSEIRRKSPDPDPAPEKWFGSSTLVQNNWDVKCTGTGLLFNRWCGSVYGSGSRIRIPDPNPDTGGKKKFPRKNSKLKFPNVNYNSNFCHACSRTFTVQYMSWIRIRISPYGSGSSFYYTDPDPRIRIHITVFNKGVYF